jgi:CRP-like cAMP-binding protein
MVDYPGPGNVILRAIPRASRAQFFSRLKHVVFNAGDQFWGTGDAHPYVMFPLRGVISLQLSPSSGKQVDVAVVGREGLAEISMFLGARKTGMIAVALTAGEAFVMKPQIFRGYLTDARFRVAIERYLRLLVVMLSHVSVCNRVHVIDQRCVGLLLQIHDRTCADSFHVTQDFFSRTLGVRRASVSRAAGLLQQQGAIRYDRRGRLTILDRGRLEQLACSCYRAMKAEFNQFMKTVGDA